MFPFTENTTSWENWSGNVYCQPKQIVHPESVEEVQDSVNLCRSDGRTLRVVGSGRSLSPLAATDDVMLSLDRMQGVLGVDPMKRTADVWAGTKLRHLTRILLAERLGQPTLGNIDAPTIAGAISTGTHGTGGEFGTLSTQVDSMTVVLGTGEVMECSEQHNRDWFKALQVSLGAMGVIVKVRLRVVPAFRTRLHSLRMTLEDCLADFNDLQKQGRHVEFTWQPRNDRVQVKVMNQTEAPLSPRPCRYLRNPRVMHSHEPFASPRRLGANEMEYSVPVDKARFIVEELRYRIGEGQLPAELSLTCRLVKADDVWLSPAFERDSVYMAVHLPPGIHHSDSLRAMEELFAHYQGRPHWGKLHYLDSRRLRSLYPMWDDFLAYRKEADPHGIFVNDYLRGLLGLNHGWSPQTV